MKYKKRNKSHAGAENVLIALVADYDNRRKAAEKAARAAAKEENTQTLLEIELFSEINKTIDSCLEFVEPFLRPYIREDIGARKGWDKSRAAPFIAKDTYYARKNEAIKKMLIAFRLILQ